MRGPRKTLTVTLAAASLSLWLGGGLACAQVQVPYNANRYHSLVAYNANTGIPLGTVITAQNWKQYQNFLPVGLQELYAGTFGWKAGTTADTNITVGPYHEYRWFKRWNEDTEKYSQQVKLVKLPSGGISISGYYAGTPFPNIDPNDPDAGGKAYLNAWFGYRPWVSDWLSPGFKVDSHGSLSYSLSETQTYHLDHLSDADSRTKPGGKGVNVVLRTMVLKPEQSKYTTSLQIWTFDPGVPQETYSFLPSSRRPLRLSAAQRCAPIAGSDNVVDDGFSGIGLQPTQFIFNYLGRHKVLLKAHVDAANGQLPLDTVFTKEEPLPAWPKPSVLGPWEVRTVDVVDATPVAGNEGYCYSHRVVYFDTQMHGDLWIDIYDADGNLWKEFELFPVFRPLTSAYVEPGATFFQQAQGYTGSRDFQNRHADASAAYHFTMDDDAPAPWNNTKVYSGPAGLQEIMR